MMILARPRNDDAERLDLVDAGVGGVEARETLSKRTSPSIGLPQVALRSAATIDQACVGTRERGRSARWTPGS